MDASDERRSFTALEAEEIESYMAVMFDAGDEADRIMSEIMTSRGFTDRTNGNY